MTTALGTGVAFGAAKGTDRPYKASGYATGSINPVSGTFTFDGTEQVAHLGRATLHGEGAFTGPTSTAFTATLVAANGDTLRLSGSGVITSGTTSTNLDTITGGTGRFAGASGELTEAVIFAFSPSDPTSVSLTFTGTGTISY
jgi:hypothetical protein